MGPAAASCDIARRMQNARTLGAVEKNGIHQVGLDPSDPFPEGFQLSDTWGAAFDLLR